MLSGLCEHSGPTANGHGLEITDTMSRGFAPASEIWGRIPILNLSNILFIIFTVLCALATSLPMLFAFRFLAGCAGAAPLVVGGGTIADMVVREQRGRYFGVFAIGAQLAPIVGPVAGGFLNQSRSLGWRWTFWVVAVVVRFGLERSLTNLTNSIAIARIHYPLRFVLSQRDIRASSSRSQTSTPLP